MGKRSSVLSKKYLAELAYLGVEMPPTEDELPYSDGEPVETERHFMQMVLLNEPLRIAWADRDVYIGWNQFLYFSLEQVRNRDYLGPDVFVVLDVPRRERKSWLVWQEGKGPDVVIELISPRMAARDKGIKKQIYQDKVRVPEYFWYDPWTGEKAGFALNDGVYVPIEPDALGRFHSAALGLLLVTWEGEWSGVTAPWWRWAALDGVVLPTAEELLQRERQQAEEAQRRAEDAEALLVRYRERFGELPGSSDG